MFRRLFGTYWLLPRKTPHNLMSMRMARYASIMALLISLLTLAHTDATAEDDNCITCDAGKYAPLPGSIRCSPCGSGAFEDFGGVSTCTNCTADIFPEETAYMGWCSVTQTEFELQADSVTTATMYHGPGDILWFDIALETISLRSILDSVDMDWAVGTEVRVGSALGEPRLLNPVVLRRISVGGQELWSPANVEPMHTTNSTRYYLVL